MGKSLSSVGTSMATKQAQIVGQSIETLAVISMTRTIPVIGARTELAPASLLPSTRRSPCEYRRQATTSLQHSHWLERKAIAIHSASPGGAAFLLTWQPMLQTNTSDLSGRRRDAVGTD